MLCMLLPSDPEQNNNIIREPTLANNTISPHSTADPRSTLSSINSTPTTKYGTVPHSSSSTLSPTTTITTSYPYLTTNHTRNFKNIKKIKKRAGAIILIWQ